MRTLSFLGDGHILIFHVDVFPFPRRFSLLGLIIYSPLPPLLSANTPFLGFFGVFPSHAHISIADSVFPPLTSYLFCFFFLPMLSRSPLLITPTGFRHSFLPAAVPRSGCSRSAESLLLFGYLLLFLTVRTNKMAACCFYSSDTGGGLEVQQH